MANARIIFDREAQEEYDSLVKTIKEEREKGISNSDNQQLLNSIDSKVERLKSDPAAGIQIPKRQIPRRYLQQYRLTNLWKMNLSGYWRMLYTLSGNKLEVICFVLEIMDHSRYDRLFGYRKK